jgi:hypothetical protein
MDEDEILQRLQENCIAEITVESLGDYCDVVDIVSGAWRQKIAKRQHCIIET